MASNNDSGDGCLAFFTLITLGIAADVAFLIAMAVYECLTKLPIPDGSRSATDGATGVL